MQLCQSRPAVSSCPNGIETAFKFQRIRCTICLTSPENQKERTPHLQDVCLPDSYVMTWCNDAAKVAAKTEVSEVRHNFTLQRCISLGSQGQLCQQTELKRLRETLPQTKNNIRRSVHLHPQYEKQRRIRIMRPATKNGSHQQAADTIS